MTKTENVRKALVFDLHTDVIRWKNWSRYMADEGLDPILFLRVGGIINAFEDAIRVVIAEGVKEDA